MSRAALSLVLAGALALLPACGDGVIGGAPDAASSGAGGTGASGGGEPGPSPRRTVQQRNPFGNVAKHDNLLWDGDFEWRISFPEQYGWYETTIGFGFLDLPTLEMGAACKSGIKCARLAPNHALLGLGKSSLGNSLEASAWVWTEAAACSSVRMTLTAITSVDPTVEVLSESEQPTGGWCRFIGTVAERQEAVYVIIDNRGPGDVIVDDVVVERIRSQPGALRRPAPPAVPIADADRAWARAWARAATRPRIVPPSEARIRFEQLLRNKRWTRR